MAFPKKAKYVIIGAGIHGLSTAWHLAEKIKNSGNGTNNESTMIDHNSPHEASTSTASRVMIDIMALPTAC